METLKRFVREEKGLETVEYAVMTALIIAAVIVAITYVRGEIVTRFNNVGDIIQSSNT